MTDAPDLEPAADILPTGAVEDKTYEPEDRPVADPDDRSVAPDDADLVADPDDREVVLEDEGYGA